MQKQSSGRKYANNAKWYWNIQTGHCSYCQRGYRAPFTLIRQSLSVFFHSRCSRPIRSIPSDRSANEDHMLPSLSTKCRVMRCDAQNVIHSCLLPGYRRALLKLRSPSSGLLLGCWTRQKHWKLTRKAGETGCHDIAAHHMSSFSIKHEAERAL